MFKKILLILKKNSFRNILRITINNVYLQKAKSYKICRALIENKMGLEIGGPSNLFSEKNLLPLYPYIKQLDNCNFSSKTIWEGQIKDGFTFKFDKSSPCGYQYVLDTTELNKISSNKYDFLLASHVIEHVANPIKALHEWVRILKNEGKLIIIIPHIDGTFDHKRNITSLSHMIEDYNNDAKENDLTHLDEILEFHDLKKDPEAGSFSQFKERSLNNLTNRCLHHHVFNTYSAVKLIDFLKLQILSVEALFPFHIIIIASKSKNYNNKEIIEKLENNKFKSPFKSDKFIKDEKQFLSI